MRESLIYNDADDIQWAVTRNDSGITISRRTNVAHTRFAGTWKNVNVADAPPAVRAVVAVWRPVKWFRCADCGHVATNTAAHTDATGHVTFYASKATP